MKNEGNVMVKVERVSEDEANVVQNFPVQSLDFFVKQIGLEIDLYGVRIVDVNGLPQFFGHPNYRTAKAKFHKNRKAGVITFNSLIPLEALQMPNGFFQPGDQNGLLTNVSLEYDKVPAFVQAYRALESLHYRISS